MTMKQTLSARELGGVVLTKKKKGVPIIRFGQIRNECWNCGNYASEKYTLPKIRGQKEYYCCNFCGSINHK